MGQVIKNDERIQCIFRRRYSEHGEIVSSVCFRLERAQRLNAHAGCIPVETEQCQQLAQELEQ